MHPNVVQSKRFYFMYDEPRAHNSKQRNIVYSTRTKLINGLVLQKMKTLDELLRYSRRQK